MSTAELLKRIQALPARERAKFIDKLLTHEAIAADRVNGKEKRVTWPNVEARARRIFGNRAIPNLVLLERDEEAT